MRSSSRMAALLACGDHAVLSHRLKETEITHHWGIPTTTAVRTLQDLSHVLTQVGELDGYETHEARFEEDREQDADLLVHGLRAVRVTWERLHDQTAEEAARCQVLLA
jgi:hypothetical protein